MAQKTSITIAVGSKNPAKLRVAKIAIKKLFPASEIIGFDVKSGVNIQPFSDEEAIGGAINRAKRFLKQVNASFGIGMEGGIQKIGKKYFECGSLAVVDKNGKVGLGSA